MDFKVGSKIGLGNPSPERNLRVSSAVRASSDLEKLTRVSKSDLRAVTDDAASVGTSDLARNAQGFAEANASAVDSIKDLTEQQLGYAQLAEVTADPRKHSAYASEISSLQTEINRVVSDATFNGQNPVRGGGISINDDTTEFHRAVQVTDYSSFSQSIDVSDFDQSAAATLAETLEGSVLSARTADSASEGVYSSASQITAETAPKSTDSTQQAEQALDSIEDATKLAEKVAQEIRNKYSPGEPDEAVIAATLDRERVKDLLA